MAIFPRDGSYSIVRGLYGFLLDSKGTLSAEMVVYARVLCGVNRKFDTFDARSMVASGCPACSAKVMKV